MGARDDVHGRRRRWFALASIVAAVLVYWLWPSRVRHYSVAIDADRSELTPWQTTHLSARIDPAPDEGWQLTWQEAGKRFGTGEHTTWKTSAPGTHTLTLIAHSPSGTQYTASVSIAVRYVDFVSPIGNQPAQALKSNPAPANLPFGIADVWIEKSEVCQGEPTRIRLTPFDDRGEQKWLVPQVADAQAWETAFVVPLSPPGMRAVPIQVADSRRPNTADPGAATTYVMINVKDCVAPFPMFLEATPIAPRNDYFTFGVRMFAGPAWLAWSHQSQALPATQVVASAPVPIVKAAHYRWDFGDHQQATTTEPTINHRYPAEADRPDEAASTYSIQVEALDESGAVMATAYSAVRIANVLRELKHLNHLVQLATEQTPWSKPNPDGSRTAEVTLANIDPVETVSLGNTVTVAMKPCDGGPPATRTLALHDIFATGTLAPGQKLTGAFTLGASDVASICWADAQVDGVTSPGQLRALGFFTLDVGKQSAYVLSPEQTAVMQQAMELLGNPAAVSDEQIRELEDAGNIPRGVLLRSQDAPVAP